MKDVKRQRITPASGEFISCDILAVISGFIEDTKDFILFLSVRKDLSEALWKDRREITGYLKEFRDYVLDQNRNREVVCYNSKYINHPLPYISDIMLDANFPMDKLSTIFPNLQGLDCCEIQHNPFAASNICKIIAETSLAKLDLDDMGIGDDGIIIIANSIHGSKLRNLNLSGNFITDKAAVAIASALRHSELETLNISDNGICTAGIDAIGRALEFSKLRDLVICTNYLDSDDLIIVCKHLAMCKLTRLDMGGSELFDTDLAIIMQLIQHSHLEWLGLSDNSIGADGVDEIIRCCGSTRLVGIDLSYNNIRDGGALKIFKSPGLRKLKNLALRENGISEPFAGILEAAWPKFFPNTILVL
jgi:hypothetical protein